MQLQNIFRDLAILKNLFQKAPAKSRFFANDRLSLTFGLIFGFSVSVISISGCGNSGRPPQLPSGSPHSSSTPLDPKRAAQNRTIPTPGTPFYQFQELVGSAPQKQFDPTDQPQSRSNKNPQATRESSGALIYTILNQEKFVLIGQEKQNSLWNFMRGSVDKGDSFVTAAMAELHQETGGIYRASQEVLLNESYDVYFSKKAKNYACTFFIKFDYVAASSILKAAISHKNPSFREMKDYAWIRLEDLERALTDNTQLFAAKTAVGNLQDFNFYPYSFEILKQAQQKNILSHLN